MESITIKVEKELAAEMDKAMKPLYSTKTEFIREAIREKIKDLRKEAALAALRKNFGAAKIKTTYEEERRIREEVGRQIAKEHGISLD